MATFVIVHGAFGGGWEWRGVAAALRTMGHVVFTPTLTGMGERFHLGPEVGLATQVQDVIGVLEFEDLRDVVLCGASYGGMVVTAAADRVPERISLVVYVDALIPHDGQSGLDLLPPAFGDAVRSQAHARGHGWAQIPDVVVPPAGLIPEHRRAHYVVRLRPQPIATFTEPVALTGAIERLPRAFVRCTAGHLAAVGDPIGPMAARARTEGWPYRELAAPHDPQLFDPAGVATLLHELAADVAGRPHARGREADAPL
ncbi:MAG TPA: alpha/beta fold hydrolase [Vicinamibacterales bacterium]|nr:alpha/beta fold hydrolase [Vicinamibacterales bacterium]